MADAGRRKWPGERAPSWGREGGRGGGVAGGRGTRQAGAVTGTIGLGNWQGKPAGDAEAGGGGGNPGAAAGGEDRGAARWRCRQSSSPGIPLQYASAMHFGNMPAQQYLPLMTGDRAAGARLRILAAA